MTSSGFLLYRPHRAHRLVLGGCKACPYIGTIGWLFCHRL